MNTTTRPQDTADTPPPRPRRTAARRRTAAPPTTTAEAGPRWPHVPMRWPDQEQFREPWMVAWLEAAASSLSVAEACRRAGIGLAQYLLGRQTDPAFDRAALVFDQIIDLMIQEATRTAALDGDPQAARIYFSFVRRPAFLPAFASWSRPAPPPPRDPPLPRHVSEAMVAAGLAAMRRDPPPPDDDDEDDTI